SKTMPPKAGICGGAQGGIRYGQPETGGFPIGLTQRNRMLALLHLSHRLPWVDPIPAVGEVVPEWLRDLGTLMTSNATESNSTSTATLADCDVVTIMWSNPFTTRRPNHMYYINRAFYDMPQRNWLMFDTITGKRVEFNIQFLGSFEEQSPVGIGSLDVEFLLRWLRPVMPVPGVASGQLPSNDRRGQENSNAVQQRSVAPNQYDIEMLPQASNPSSMMPLLRQPVVQPSNSNMQQSMSRPVVQPSNSSELQPPSHPQVQRMDGLGPQQRVRTPSLPQNFGQVPANHIEAPPYLQLPLYNPTEAPPLIDNDGGIDLVALGRRPLRPSNGPVSELGGENHRALANQQSAGLRPNAPAPPPASSKPPAQQQAEDSDDDLQILDSAPPVFQAEQNGRKRRADDPLLSPSSKRAVTATARSQRQEGSMGGNNPPQSAVSRETSAVARQPAATHNPPTRVSTSERQALREKIQGWRNLPAQEQGRLLAELPQRDRKAIKEEARHSAAKRRAARRTASSQTVAHRQPSAHAPDTPTGISTQSGPSGVATLGEQEARMAEWFAGLPSEKQLELLGKAERRTTSVLAAPTQNIQSGYPAASSSVTLTGTTEQPRSQVLQPMDSNRRIQARPSGQRTVEEGVSRPGVPSSRLADMSERSLGQSDGRMDDHIPTSHAANPGPTRGGQRPLHHLESPTSRQREGQGQYEVQAQAGRKRQRDQEIIDVESEKRRKTAEHPHSAGFRHPSNQFEHLTGIEMPYSYDGLMFDDGSLSDIPLTQDTPADLQALVELNPNGFGFPNGQPHLHERPSYTRVGVESGVGDTGLEFPSVEQATATSAPEMSMPPSTDKEAHRRSQLSPSNPSATGTQTSTKCDSASGEKRSRRQFVEDEGVAEDVPDHPSKRHQGQHVDGESATAMPASSVRGPVTESQGQSNQAIGVKVNGTQEDKGAAQQYHQPYPAKLPTTPPPPEQAPPDAGLTEDFPSDIDDDLGFNVDDYLSRDIIPYADLEEVNGSDPNG
ncbi:MAG: hypothetical protein Q9181_007404, partial [Wetmoreana brouardii]